MSDQSGAAGLAALSLCESLLLSLTDSGVIDAAAAKGIFAEAAVARREAVPHASGDQAAAVVLLETLVRDGDTVRWLLPAPALHGNPEAT